MVEERIESGEKGDFQESVQDAAVLKTETLQRKAGISVAGVLGITASILMCVAIVFALLPWIELNPTLLQGVSMLSGLISAFGDGSVTLPTLSSAYSIFSLIDLAQVLGKLQSLLQQVESSSGIISVSQETVTVLGQLSYALYVVVLLWAAVLLVSAIGIIRCLIFRGQKSGVLAIGAALLFTVSGLWACTYNVALTYIAGASGVLSGVSVFSIICGAICIIAWLLSVFSAIFALRRCARLESIDSEAVPNVCKKTRKTMFAAVAASVLIICTVVYIVISAVTGFPLKGIRFEEPTSAAMETSTSGKTHSTYLSKSELADLVAATVDGAELSEEAIVDYIDEFRVSAGVGSNSNWRDWLAENGYTAEMVRQEVIDYYINQYLLDLVCEENGIEISDAQVAGALAEVKSSFEEGAFEASLAESNMTEEAYVQSVIIPTLQHDAIMEKVIKESPATEEEAEEIFQKWLDDQREKHDIVISQMPSGLPYDV